MALPAGKATWVAAMVQADLDFLAAYGGTLDPAAQPRLTQKYEAQYDALVAAITTNAVVSGASIT